MSFEISSEEGVRYLRCVDTVADRLKRPSRIRLSVREPWRCLPCFTRRKVIATFFFREDGWTRTSSGDYQNVAFCGIPGDRLRKLRRMDPNLRITEKAWLEWESTKCLLSGSLGDVLRMLEESSPSSGAVPIGSPSSSLDAGNGQPTAAGGEEKFTEGWVTSVDPSTGSKERLPAHTKKEDAARWSGPGAWTARGKQQQEWGPVAVTPPGDKQSPVTPQLDSALSSQSATMEDPKSRKDVSMVLGRRSKPPPPRRARRRVVILQDHHQQLLSWEVLITFGFIILMALLMWSNNTLPAAL